MRLKLREYQQQGISDVRRAFGQGARSVIYVLSTGGGKTVTYAAVAEGAAKKGNKVLILEHRRELIEQASCAMAGLGIYHRVLAPDDVIDKAKKQHIGRFDDSYIKHNSPVMVASVQTLAIASRIELLKSWSPDVIIVDEAHHAVAGTWARIIEACPDAIVLGVTATPCRSDNRGLGDVFETMVLGPPPSFLVDEGFLVPPRLIVPPTQLQMDGVHRRSGDFIRSELEAATDRPVITGCAIDHYSKIAPNRPNIVFCVSVKHAKHVQAQFKQAGYKFELVTGDESEMDVTRGQAIGGLASGIYDGIVTVDVVSEGTDIPVAEVATMIRRTDSLGLYMQQGGRVLRPVYADGYDLESRAGRLAAIEASGKTHGIILDHVGNYWEHGSPTEDREWTLDTTKMKRKRDTGPAPRIVQCPACYGFPESNPCEWCGYKFEAKALRDMQQVEGELVDVTEMERQKQEQRAAQGRARTVEDLIKATGMNRHRAAHIVKAREEKDRLRVELSNLIAEVKQKLGVAPGIEGHEIGKLKPKALKEHIDRLGGMLFKGDDEESPRKSCVV
jgi:superfamily II DNA or RNA helicase